MLQFSRLLVVARDLRWVVLSSSTYEHCMQLQSAYIGEPLEQLWQLPSPLQGVSEFPAIETVHNDEHSEGEGFDKDRTISSRSRATLPPSVLDFIRHDGRGHEGQLLVAHDDDCHRPCYGAHTCAILSY